MALACHFTRKQPNSLEKVLRFVWDVKKETQWKFGECFKVSMVWSSVRACEGVDPIRRNGAWTLLWETTPSNKENIPSHT